MAQQVISGNQQPFGGPNSGLGDEEGDLWNLVVSKLNSMFAELYAGQGNAGQIVITSSVTLNSGYNGATVIYYGSSAIVVTVPSGLSPSFNCAIVQMGTGQITVAAGGGVSVNNAHGLTMTFGQYSIIGLTAVAQDVFVLTGDGA